MAGSAIATGRIVALPYPLVSASGATHALRDEQGRTTFLLRSRVLTLDRFVGETARVVGRPRGWVGGDPAPIFDVTEAHHLYLLPAASGPSRFATGGAVFCHALPVRGFFWLPLF